MHTEQMHKGYAESEGVRAKFVYKIIAISLAVYHDALSRLICFNTSVMTELHVS